MSWDATYSIASRRADVAAFADVFESFCMDRGVPSAVMRAFQVAFDEWLTNIVDYAHADRGDAEIRIGLELTPDALVAEVSDSGEPFNPLTEPGEPSLDLGIEDRPIGGLGVHLIRTLMDEISYRRDAGRNHLRMVKHRQPVTE
ncbi:ATP-binding protein [Pseudomarimonas salicorniae]|uniref:ATP-binding protein n=1 Tax=Pseudomarimonas salicorniae TaxID=2933270 RepID=A0ABT0GEV0_9GAMM|nr:ATP-binding protein [Lysobacter sp. CAU 1642]MCK7593076.1 ATP-binding protein [Lysobacter sp. CAU 1642]